MRIMQTNKLTYMQLCTAGIRQPEVGQHAEAEGRGGQDALRNISATTQVDRKYIRVSKAIFWNQNSIS
jgi:hypothetical protein